MHVEYASNPGPNHGHKFDIRNAGPGSCMGGLVHVKVILFSTFMGAKDASVSGAPLHRIRLTCERGPGPNRTSQKVEQHDWLPGQWMHAQAF
jgi:hypothetical protein